MNQGLYWALRIIHWIVINLDQNIDLNESLAKTELGLTSWDLDEIYRQDSGPFGDGSVEYWFLLPEGYDGLAQCGKGGFGPVQDLYHAYYTSKAVAGREHNHMRLVLSDRMLIR